MQEPSATLVGVAAAIPFDEIVAKLEGVETNNRPINFKEVRRPCHVFCHRFYSVSYILRRRSPNQLDRAMAKRGAKTEIFRASVMRVTSLSVIWTNKGNMIEFCCASTLRCRLDATRCDPASP